MMLVVALVLLLIAFWLLAPRQAGGHVTPSYYPLPQALIGPLSTPLRPEQAMPSVSEVLPPTPAGGPPSARIAASPGLLRPDDTHVGVSEPRIAATTATPAPSASSGSGSMAAGPAVLRGVASWYATGGPGVYGAAGPALRRGHWRGSLVTVCVARCLALRLTDYCACLGTRLIDLSLGAVYALGLDPSRGIYEVEVMMP